MRADICLEFHTFKLFLMIIDNERSGVQGKNTSLLALIHQYYIIGDLIPLGYSFEILKQALKMIFKMTVLIKFGLSPRGTSNSPKFAHEHLLNQFFIDQVVTGLIATGLLLPASLWNYGQRL